MPYVQGSFQEKGIQLVVPPTVIQELFFLTKDEAKRDLAMQALQCMREWKLTPFDLIPVGHGITEQFTSKLINRRLLPEEEVMTARF